MAYLVSRCCYPRNYYDKLSCCFFGLFVAGGVKLFIDGFCFVPQTSLRSCPVENRSPDNALTFQEMLQAHQAPIPVLPWQQLNLPQQLSLFEL